MGRYSPSVLPQPAPSFLASLLTGGVQGFQQGMEMKNMLEERDRRKALFDLQMAQAGAMPTRDWTQTVSRPAQARAAFARELAPAMAPAAVAGSPTATAEGALSSVLAGVRDVQGQAAASGELPPSPMPVAAPLAPGQKPGKPMKAPAPPRPITGTRMADYLNYADRPRGMAPYQAGQYTVDPMLAYDRSRAASSMEEGEMARALAGVRFHSPVAEALARAGKVTEALRAEQNSLTYEGLMNTEEGRRMRFGISSGQRDVELGLRRDEMTQRAQIARIQAAGKASEADVNLYREHISSLTRAEDRLARIKGTSDQAVVQRAQVQREINALNRLLDREYMDLTGQPRDPARP